MITLLEKGDYRLIETKGQAKILIVGKRVFAWINVKDIGEILISSHKPHIVDHFLAAGKYRIYDVEDEPNMTDLEHLELLAGDGLWQGYLLPTGMPTEQHKRNRIIPTSEIITKSVS